MDLGTLSNRELARKYGLGESTIRDHASKRGWQRDLRRRMVQRAQQILDAQDQRAMEHGAAQDDAQPSVRDSNGGNGHIVEDATGAILRPGNVIAASMRWWRRASTSCALTGTTSVAIVR